MEEAMRLKGWLCVLVAFAVVACSGETVEEAEPAAEPAEAEAAAEPTPDEAVAAMQADCAAAAEAIAARQAESSLYDRLGGREAIEGVVTEIIRLHHENEAIAHMFEDVDDAALIASVSDYISEISGGDATYEGEDMVSVHTGMDITNDLFIAAGVDVQAAMVSLGIGENEIQEIMCHFASKHGEVVGV